MSVLPCQTALNSIENLFAGGYMASGGMSSNIAFIAGNLPCSNGFTVAVYNFNSNVMPEVGKSYLVSVSGAVSGLTGAGSGANAFVNMGLQYDSGVVGNSVAGMATVIPGSSVSLFNITDIFQRVVSPTVPLRLIIGNNTGSNITAGTLRITAVNVVEVPNPVVLGDAQLNP